MITFKIFIKHLVWAPECMLLWILKVSEHLTGYQALYKELFIMISFDSKYKKLSIQHYSPHTLHCGN